MTSLTYSIGDSGSPLRHYLNETFPNLRPIQLGFRQSGGDLAVDAGSSNPGTIGAAFDYLVRMALDPTYIAQVSFYGFLTRPAMLTALRDVVIVARDQAAGARSGDATENLLRACWVLALTTEVYRSGQIAPGSPLSTLIALGPALGHEQLLGLASPNALTELQLLHRQALTHLYPEIPTNAKLELGPTFEASALCAADADLIFDGCLVDLKTHLGPKSKGARYDALSLQEAYQLVGYALFDRRDEFEIRSVAIYSGRYGHFVRWDLQEFLATLAGREVDLAAERTRVWRILGGA